MAATNPPSPCPPSRLRLAAAGDALPVAFDEVLRSTAPAPAPRLSDPTPEASLLEDLLLAAAALRRRLEVLDAVAPRSPGETEPLRLGARVTEEGVVEPALAAALYRGDRFSAAHLAFDPAVAAASPAERALALLRSPARLLGRHPEILPELFAHPVLRASLRNWAEAVHAREAWPEIRTPHAMAVLPGDRAALARQSPSTLAALLLAAESTLNYPARLESEALAVGLWIVKSLNYLSLARGAAAGRAVAHALLESPFYGADAELLGARLGALRRALSGAVPLGLRPELLPLLLAVYQLPGLDAALKPPLWELAARVATGPERQLARSGVEPAWPADLPALPTQAARFLLERGNTPWLDRLGDAARAELLEAMEAAPAELSWVWPAVFREPERLSDEERARLLACWRAARPGAPHEHNPRWILGGLALSAGLSREDQQALAAVAAETEDRWRIGLLRLVAERAPEARAEAVEQLKRALRDGERTLRPPAVVALLRLVREGHLEASKLDEIEALLDADLRRHPHVLEERRRLGRDR